MIKSHHFQVVVLMLLFLAFSPSAIAQNHQSTTGPIPPRNVSAPHEYPPDPNRAENVISSVPSYNWHHGCGPTAVGMVVGYYDGIGFADLIPGNAATQTSAVNQAIASEDSSANPQHYEDYSEPIDSSAPSILPDKSEDPAGDEHISNCIADFMETSFSARNNRYGWSWSNDIGPAFRDYVTYAAPHYTPTFSNFYFGSDTWDLLVAEVNANRPLVFLVDTDGSGGTDHFVTVIGYRDSSGYPEYACLDTWYAPIRWERFQGMSSGNNWGIFGGTTFAISGPTSIPSLNIYGLLMLLGVLSLILRRYQP